MLSDRKCPRVFVVDDEPMIAATLEMILRQSGFDAHYFTVPEYALIAAAETPPDLLITDVMMPMLTGIALSLRIRERCPDCKVLLFSGVASGVDLVATAREAGQHFELLVKPVHPSVLIKKARMLMAS